ncbi:hypothetical protein [Rhodanobacter umsongensis]
MIAMLPGFRDWGDVAAFRDQVERHNFDAAAFERLASRIKQQFQITIAPETLSSLLHNVVEPAPKKIRKSGPFSIARIAPDYPWFSTIMANAIQQLRELPDFSDDKKIFVMSDFSGEHSSARFYTYSFILLAQDKIGPFEKKVKELREKHGLLDPYSEFAYKRLTSGARSRALPEFLQLVDNYIHGAVITVAVEKQIDTLFGTSKREAQAFMVEQLASMGFGEWKGPAAEKVARVCHALAIFVSLMTTANQRLLWYCDEDTINVDGNKRTFASTQKLFAAIMAMYATHTLDIVGMAKSFQKKGYMDDLLSVADLAAGVVQDLLQGHTTGENIPGGEEKVAVIKWMAAPATFLSKINIQIVRLENGQVGSGLIDFTPKQEAIDPVPEC